MGDDARAARVRALCDDLTAETVDLLALLEPLDEDAWLTPTPAAGWNIRDQVTHLAYFDEATALAATDPEAFAARARELTGLGDDFSDVIAARCRDLAGPAALDWFIQARAALSAALLAADPTVKLPWFGPPMNSASSATARLMETWAHGQDVADALGRERVPTVRLRPIAHLGVATMAWGFTVRGRPIPADPVRVELTAPECDRWEWGPDSATSVLRGPALDFCLLVTQRRHRDDLRLEATGEPARRWLEVAQIFAGPPGPGRPPGANVPDPSGGDRILAGGAGPARCVPGGSTGGSQS
ncbi:TIGR03084 family metal-binding protein [Pseudofrankia sp. BMG5.37]|uniref:TIGR03084 family metal-binding protein n=1 Tax=Pseudofrankia sp. BMG5.37 TaxID=3050035 RepID=UPI00289628EB|nr:TIGR03084 family metal-binding protein [Pseudofrankia sp. BMG5.37]MDT3440188.1 TIGR03084 family metal-binding protein [Pseudofrankia sp. BMG5.37]